MKKIFLIVLTILVLSSVIYAQDKKYSVIVLDTTPPADGTYSRVDNVEEAVTLNLKTFLTKAKIFDVVTNDSNLTKLVNEQAASGEYNIDTIVAQGQGIGADLVIIPHITKNTVTKVKDSVGIGGIGVGTSGVEIELNGAIEIYHIATKKAIFMGITEFKKADKKVSFSGGGVEASNLSMDKSNVAKEAVSSISEGLGKELVDAVNGNMSYLINSVKDKTYLKIKKCTSDIIDEDSKCTIYQYDKDNFKTKLGDATVVQSDYECAFVKLDAAQKIELDKNKYYAVFKVKSLKDTIEDLEKSLN